MRSPVLHPAISERTLRDSVATMGGRTSRVIRIGLLSDTHIPEACEHVPDRALQVLQGVELIMHAGDVYVNRVLDELERVAPVIAAVGNGDEGLDGHKFKLEPDLRVSTAHVVNAGKWRIGLAHALPTPDETSDQVFLNAMKRHFGAPVDVLVVGHSHVEGVARFGRTLVVNPGSATLPRNLVGVPGTVGIVEIAPDGELTTEIIKLG
jgi:putative phosphoesterase